MNYLYLGLGHLGEQFMTNFNAALYNWQSLEYLENIVVGSV